ncbi:unnamed protein product [Ectocarpus sp. 4 AP-2014]
MRLRFRFTARCSPLRVRHVHCMYVRIPLTANALKRHTGQNQDQMPGWLRVVLIGQRSNIAEHFAPKGSWEALGGARY